MTENEKTIFNNAYKKHSEYSKDIINAANNITKPYTQELEKCIEKILQACSGETGQIVLNYDELEKLALKIPALCMYVQLKLNDFSLRSNIESLIIDAQVIETLNGFRGEKGDAREKMKRAEAEQLNDRIVETLDKQICSNLKDIIVRADKVYEGVKKIIDARMRENEYNRKSQQFNP